MASKGKGKTKIKLKRKEFVVEGKIIDLDRFAFDFFAHSAAKFGVADGCITKLQEGENDYGLPDFIVVLSRFVFRCQIKGRNLWYACFKRYYETTKFKSFESIKNALQKALETLSEYTQISYKLIATLALMSELVIFLYSENCSLHLIELGKFWSECWCSRKKALEKSGGLVGLYRTFNNPDESKVDIFFNKFIPVYCIPYDGSRELQNIFDEEFKKYFNLTQEKLDAMEKDVQDSAASRDALLRELASQLSVAHEAAQKPKRTLRVHKTPRNTGLGIRKHEDLLHDVLGTDTKTSPNTQSKSDQKSSTDCRGSTGKKVRQKKPSSQLATVAVSQPLETAPIEAEAALNTPVEDLESETLRNTGLGIQGHDELLRDIFGTKTASPEDLSSKHHQKTLKDRRSSAGKKERQKKPSSPLTKIAVSQPLESGLMGAKSTLKTLGESSESETPKNTGFGIQVQNAKTSNVQGKSGRISARDHRGSAGKKERQKKPSSSVSSLADSQPSETAPMEDEAVLKTFDEDLESETPRNTGLGKQDLAETILFHTTRFFETKAASPEDLSSKHHQKTAKDSRGSSTQKERRSKKSSLGKMVSSPEQSHTVLGAEAASFLDKDSDNETFVNTGLGIQTREDLHQDVFGTIIESVEEAISSSHQKTAKDRKGSASKKKNRKTSSPIPATESPESEEHGFWAFDYLNLPRPTHKLSAQASFQISHQDPGEIIKRREFPQIKTKSQTNLEDVDSSLGLPRGHPDASLHENAVEIERNTGPEPFDWMLKMIDEIPISSDAGSSTKYVDMFLDQTNPRLTVEESEHLETGFATSSRYLFSSSRQETEKEAIGSSSRRSFKKDLEQMETAFLGAKAATSSKKREDSGSDDSIISDLGMSAKEFLRLVGICKRASSDSD